MIIEQHTIEEWLSDEKPYMRRIVGRLLEGHSEEETAKILLSLKGVENTKSFGGFATQRADDVYWTRFKKEFDMFICGHPKYQQLRDDILKNSNIITIFNYITNCFNFSSICWNRSKFHNCSSCIDVEGSF